MKKKTIQIYGAGNNQHLKKKERECLRMTVGEELSIQFGYEDVTIFKANSLIK